MPRRLVLVGAGHAHALVLASWARHPIAGVEGVLVVDRPDAVYSGLAPARILDEVDDDALRIDAAGLAEAAGFRLVVDPLAKVDAGGKRLVLRSGRGIRYDVASLDIGAVVQGLDLPGVREHAVATRPLSSLLSSLDVPGDAPLLRAVVVGSGAGGIEVAACLKARWEAAGRVVDMTVVGGRSEPLADRPAAVGVRMRAVLESLGVTWMGGVSAVEVGEGDVCLDDGHVLPSDRTVWVTGAAFPPALAGGDLPRSEDGFVRVGPTLEVAGCRDLYAVGDCAHLDHAPDTPRAGVHAVRAAPVLDRNLRAALGDGATGEFHPRRHPLALLDLGDGTVFGTLWGLTARGRWLRWIKRWIDRRFVRRLARVVARAQARRSA